MRGLLTLFILVIAASLQSSVALLLAKAHLGIDLLLLCVLCCAMVARAGPALAVALIAGLFKDALSAGVAGHSVAVFVPLSLLVNSFRTQLWVAHWTTQAGCALACTVMAWLLYNILGKIWGEPFEWAVGALIARSFLNACATPPLFKLWQAVLR